MAVDPTAPVSPIIPTVPAGTALESSAIAQALARQALAGSTAQLVEIAGQAPGNAASVPAQATSASQSAAKDAGRSAAALDGRSAPAQDAPGIGSAKSTLDPRAARVVRLATAEAVPRQAGLAPLMADLRAVVDEPDVPPTVRDAGRALLSTTPTIQDITTGRGLRLAVERSGVLLEAHLARAATAPPGVAATRPLIVEGDVKAALWVFRSALSAWLAKVAPPSDAGAPPAPSASEDATAEAAGAPKPLARENSASDPKINASPVAATPPGQSRQAAAVAEAPLPATMQTPAPAAINDADSAAPTRPATPTAVLPDGQDADPELAARFGAFVAIPEKAAERASSKVSIGGSSLPTLLQVEPLDSEDAPQRTSLAEPRSLVTRGYAGAAEERPRTPPPPYAGGPTTGQKPPEQGPPLIGAPEAVARRLLKGTQSALARQDLMQIASLSESLIHEHEAGEARPVATKLNFDLPFVTPQGVAVAQFEISRDGGGAGAGGAATLEQTYRARFSIDVEPLGPVHAQVVLAGSRARVSLWAERSETIARLRAGEEALGAALRQAELTPEVAVHSGAPPTPGGGPLGHFVDQAS